MNYKTEQIDTPSSSDAQDRTIIKVLMNDYIDCYQNEDEDGERDPDYELLGGLKTVLEYYLTPAEQKSFFEDGEMLRCPTCG